MDGLDTSEQGEAISQCRGLIVFAEETAVLEGVVAA